MLNISRIKCMNHFINFNLKYLKIVWNNNLFKIILTENKYTKYI